MNLTKSFDINLLDTQQEKQDNKQNYNKEKDKVNTEFENLRQFHMYFQTTIRNVALTTAVTCAILGYSRFYRNKNFYFYNNLLVIASILVISISCYLNILLMINVNKNKNRDGFNYLNNYFNINLLFLLVHIILLPLGVLTLIRNSQ